MKKCLLLLKNLIVLIILLLNSSLAYSQRLIKLGQEEIKNKNYSQAIKILSEAIQKHPKEQDGYYFLAIAYRENNQLTEAEGALLDGIAIGGNIDYKLYFELGNIMFKRGKGYYNLAIRYYSSSIKNMPNYDKALLNRANSYVEQGKINFKEKDYKNAWDSYTMAIHDYSQFITLRYESSKKNAILHMINLLRNKKADLEKLDKTLQNRSEEHIAKGQSKEQKNTQKYENKQELGTEQQSSNSQQHKNSQNLTQHNNQQHKNQHQNNQLTPTQHSQQHKNSQNLTQHNNQQQKNQHQNNQLTPTQHPQQHKNSQNLTQHNNQQHKNQHQNNQLTPTQHPQQHKNSQNLTQHNNQQHKNQHQNNQLTPTQHSQQHKNSQN
ncbi:tetratricopeptide repeat protein, partial [Borrelia hispanica]|uniref:tetratricopeptide repeat protein n=1 Tax=Borrelia hispanica TaxID=40835 RepID=UPI00046710D0